MSWVSSQIETFWLFFIFCRLVKKFFILWILLDIVFRKTSWVFLVILLLNSPKDDLVGNLKNCYHLHHFDSLVSTTNSISFQASISSSYQCHTQLLIFQFDLESFLYQLILVSDGNARIHFLQGWVEDVVQVSFIFYIVVYVVHVQVSHTIRESSKIEQMNYFIAIKIPEKWLIFIRFSLLLLLLINIFCC